jgi:hypothetical protein
MTRDRIRGALLGVCLLGAAVDVLALHSTPRLLLGVVLLGGAAVLAVRITRERKAAGDEHAPVEPVVVVPVEANEPKSEPVSEPQTESQTQPRLRLAGRRPAKLELALTDVRKELEEQKHLTLQVASQLAHSDGLRRAMWLTIDGRLSALETEVGALRDARERHLRDVDRLHERMQTHKRELAALTEVLGDSTSPTHAKAARVAASSATGF